MPKGITIVGLGPGAPGLLTVEAQRLVASASEIHVRTQKHPTVAALPQQSVIHSFDAVYEQGETFEQVYADIAARVVELGRREQGVVYAVPGHPLVGEASVQCILTLAREQGLPVCIVEGLSFIEPLCTRLEQDPLSGWQIADATTLAIRHYPEVNPDAPLLIGQLYSREIAADIKLALMMIYPDEHPVTLVKAAGTRAEALITIPLYELDRCADLDHLTSLFVPPLPEPGSLAAFQEVVARLRAPGGCPWDREQTHSSLRPFLLEEAYEVLEALDNEDIASLEEELGDLLLQILLHTQIAIEDAEFKMADVVGHIVAKLKRRHPHVFGETRVADAQEVLVNWQRIKSEEKAESNHATPQGALSGIPTALPALARAQALRLRASRVGFDWPDIADAWAKVEEEKRELQMASTVDEQDRELGDILFALATLGSWLNLDAESALRRANARFEQRFQAIESACATRGQKPEEMEPAELMMLWEQLGEKKG